MRSKEFVLDYEWGLLRCDTEYLQVFKLLEISFNKYGKYSSKIKYSLKLEEDVVCDGVLRHKYIVIDSFMATVHTGNFN